MDIETTRAKMMAQFDQARQSATARACGWVFAVEELTVYVTMRARRKQDRSFLLRVMFEDFPRRAPSYVFVEANTRQVTDAAWPPNVKHGSPPPGICTPGTRECHEHYHKNDAKYTWDADKETFLSTLQMIHRLMERGVGG